MELHFAFVVFVCFIFSPSLSFKPHGESEYGVDHTYPIHHYLDKNLAPQQFVKFYEEKMEGCYKEFSKRECDATERARLEMSMAQPASQHNYTEIGFKKIKLPKHVWEPLLAFYEQNKHNQHLEAWPRGYTYVNVWESPSYMVSLEDRSLRGGLVLKQHIWDGVQPIIEEWVGRKITPTSMYGIRVYRDKAILAPHVDRLPLVSSCIINVAQDVNEPWPIEVYDHNGQAHNVTMEPGDMVLYESHTVLHGRPFPMNGNHYANIFVHYQPIDHEETQRKDAEMRNQKTKSKSSQSATTTSLFGTREVKRKIGGHEQDQHDPEDIQRHLDQITREETRVSKELLHAVKDLADRILSKEEGSAVDVDDETLKSNEKQLAFDEQHFERDEVLRRCASRGDYAGVVRMFKKSSAVEVADMLDSHDSNGWQAIHEAVRSGNLDVVRLLVDSGADLGSRVSGGGAALWVAENTLTEGHEVTAYLVRIGAPRTSVNDIDSE